jgi:uncharacterized membrane protein HdeD (DUF308 family)
VLVNSGLLIGVDKRTSQEYVSYKTQVRRQVMNFFGIGISGLVAAIIAIVLGIIMLVKPQIVAYLIGAYLLFIGIMFLVQTYIV